jgi:hypothetical protein
MASPLVVNRVLRLKRASSQDTVSKFCARIGRPRRVQMPTPRRTPHAALRRARRQTSPAAAPTAVVSRQSSTSGCGPARASVRPRRRSHWTEEPAALPGGYGRPRSTSARAVRRKACPSGRCAPSSPRTRCSRALGATCARHRAGTGERLGPPLHRRSGPPEQSEARPGPVVPVPTGVPPQWGADWRGDLVALR